MSSTWTYLAPNPKSYLRQLFVKGTDFTAWNLYVLAGDEEESLTPEEIAAGHDIPVAAVHEAIAYCQSDPPELRQDFADQEAWFAARRWNKWGMLLPEGSKLGQSPL